MKIKVIDGSAVITTDIPVFIGATGEGRFPLPGERMLDFWFQPKKDACGYLVFDHKDETQRTPSSPTFVHYSWNAGSKLIVDEGLKLERSIHGQYCTNDRKLGLLYSDPKNMTEEGVHYFTGTPVRRATALKKVGVLDLLRFIEARITLDQLDKLVIE